MPGANVLPPVYSTCWAVVQVSGPAVLYSLEVSRFAEFGKQFGVAGRGEEAGGASAGFRSAEGDHVAHQPGRSFFNLMV